MYVKTLIFIIALIFLTGKSQAGVISALWLGEGRNEVGMGAFVVDSDATDSSDEQRDDDESIIALTCCDAGFSGVTTSSSGTSSVVVAWSGNANLSSFEPQLHCRFRIDNDLLPDSPTLYGLLKPS